MSDRALKHKALAALEGLPPAKRQRILEQYHAVTDSIMGFLHMTAEELGEATSNPPNTSDTKKSGKRGSVSYSEWTLVQRLVAAHPDCSTKQGKDFTKAISPIYGDDKFKAVKEDLLKRAVDKFKPADSDIFTKEHLVDADLTEWTTALMSEDEAIRGFFTACLTAVNAIPQVDTAAAAKAAAKAAAAAASSAKAPAQAADQSGPS